MRISESLLDRFFLPAGVQSTILSPSIPTPTPGSPKIDTAASPQLAPQAPSQMLTALLARLPDATNRTLIDQAAVDFAFLNTKAARKRLIKVCFFSVSSSSRSRLDLGTQFFTQIPKNRNDVLPYYSRFIATLSKYMPDVGEEVIKYVGRTPSQCFSLTTVPIISSATSSSTCSARKTSRS
jgi:hypothetical protein